MSANETLTLCLPVAEVRAALEAHDQHKVLEQALRDANLSDEELERRRKEKIELENEARDYAKGASKRRAELLGGITAALRDITSDPTRFHEARPFMTALLFEMKSNNEEGDRIDFVVRQIDELESAYRRNDIARMREVIECVAEYAEYRAGNAKRARGTV
ncbi:hypothetical protein CBM2615_A120002 [Cupriavidus taiwanensis]|uniref:Uncharacterized protein n=1 Tax=Cupriavidus taiwanensis TaxID=164546 RepID=A0A976ASW6_9BURK|nr:hypothetical protein [Cupriavidus taiwanensis]SOZ49050.1 hypothetical protein CBM2614_A120002 [Cupriavidus taiwanensis]SOZ49076.1 hypothetical protein CBM2615_A120002 [Cupriavidus taiwanensis]SOZ51756.1 hypothetical protein CBM2613_A110002 [Cupriavidus taiwanensis]SPA07013.1 hypothetical protein CBM2625_A90002 [Cupriavidus taiwanensis]